MEKGNTPAQNGAIIFWHESNVSHGLTLPAEGSGERANKTVDATNSGIAMSDIPSASTITLKYRKAPDDWVVHTSITFLTTHRPASLDRTQYSYLQGTYSVGDFVSEGLGLKVIAKTGSALLQADMKANHQIDCEVQLSKFPPSA